MPDPAFFMCYSASETSSKLVDGKNQNIIKNIIPGIRKIFSTGKNFDSMFKNR
jgi:hypothetical protein